MSYSHSRSTSLVSNSSVSSQATNHVNPADGLPANTFTPTALKRRSTGISLPPPPLPEPTTKLARNVAPGLLARMKFLNHGANNNVKNEPANVGRIDDGTIRKLDDFHQKRTLNIERRGQAWTGNSGSGSIASSASPLVPQLTGESTISVIRSETSEFSRPDDSIIQKLDIKSEPNIGRIDENTIRALEDLQKERPFVLERRGTSWTGVSDTASVVTASQTGTPLLPQLTGDTVPAMEAGFESDRSSVVSTSDKVLPSESDAGADDVLDMQKYRLPDITKSKTLFQSISEPDSGTDTATNDPTRPPTPPPKDLPTDTNISLKVTPRDTPREISPARGLPHSPSQDTLREPPQQSQIQPEESPEITPAEEVSVLDDHNDIDIESYFKRRHLRSTGSVYSLSKASFTNQIQGLTSMKLPPTTIASEITALPSSTLAARALHKAANDIRLWMAKAAEVLDGLDAEDDVEWAAAAGREGLAEVDAAIGKFEGLVTVYITAIEDLQARSDINALPSRDLTTLVTQMEEIISTWSKIKETLKGIKNQVEMAMEWEELWNKVLGEIGHEIEELSRHVFEMEERRHRVISDSVAEAPEKFEIADLETIVEETPRLSKIHNHRFSLPPNLMAKAQVSPIPQIEQENSRLLALFAKLQPLRASLDFLPMRLASFQSRAADIFPSACDELKRRKEQLEQQEKKLESDAEALREELGEDKWVHSFRQAGSKAVALYDSCMKSVQKLQQAIDENDEEKTLARIAQYTDKRDHYPPSMRRVLELIDIEMKHRSTVNGEILRIQQDVRAKVLDLEAVNADMDKILEEFNTARQLRDSVSTTLSLQTEGSLANSTIATPNSSPASSVVASRKNSGQIEGTPSGKPRLPQITTSRAPSLSNRRHSSVFTGVVPRKGAGPTYIEGAIYNRSLTPTQPRYMRPTASTHETPKTERPAVKPRWNSSTNMNDTAIGHNFKPISLTTPSPYRRPERPMSAMRSASSASNIPVRSPLSRSATTGLSPSVSSRPPSTMSNRRPLASPMQSPTTPARGKLPMRSTPGSSSHLSPSAAESGGDESPIARRTVRSVSAVNNRRSSYMAPTKKRTTSTSSITSTTETAGSTRSASRLNNIDEGRNSRASRASGRQSSLADRPVWK